MGDTKQLRKDHNALKGQLNHLVKEYEKLQGKMADKLDKSHSPTSEDVQGLNITCDGLLTWRKEEDTAMANFKAKLEKLVDLVDIMSKELDNVTAYSYQYNLKITGVPQERERETADETTNLSHIV